MLKNAKDLKVWQKSYERCLEIYRITAKFPKEERYGRKTAGFLKAEIGSTAQIGFLDLRVGQEVFRISFQYKVAALEDIAPLGELKRHAGILLHE
jgi:hypothetical protein